MREQYALDLRLETFFSFWLWLAVCGAQHLCTVLPGAEF